MRLCVLAMIFMATTANAQSSGLNVSLPTPAQNYQTDSFKAGDLDCKNAIGSATNLEFGVTSVINGGGYDSMNRFINDTGNVGVYARITIPLGKVAKQRINCNTLYELELRKKKLEVMRLELEIKRLQNIEYEFEE